MAGAQLITPVILVGGGGSRLWPVSTPNRPKQFIALVDGQTLLAATLARVAADAGAAAGLAFAPPIVVGGVRHRERIAAEIRQSGLGKATVLLEPFGRNTAAAIAVATEALSEQSGGDSLALILSSDHDIRDVGAFHHAIARAIAPAREGRLVTFGIVPTRPETGYGYIQRGRGSGGVFEVERFVEKPSTDLARSYLASGDHDWNAGIFMFRADAMIDALARHVPKTLEHARASLARAQSVPGGSVLDADAFAHCPSISIDDAVMAQSRSVSVVPVDMGWSDVGSWTAIHEIAERDAMGNGERGRVLTEGVENSYLRADDGLVAAIGVANVAIVKSGGTVLVTSLGAAQDVRAIEARVAALSGPPAHGEVDLSALAPSASALVAWMRTKALPLWGSAGWDENTRAFREALGPDGQPCAEPFRRLRVQARQIYAFSAAHALGWDGPYLDLAWRGFESLVARGWLAEGGWAHRFDTSGAVIDPMRDAYDHAFVLFALAWLHRATGSEEPLGWARRTLAWLDAVLVDPVHGGYRESLPDVLPRRANPHMHLLEALIALYDATRDVDYLTRADALVALFRRRFLARDTMSLREFFAPDWSPAPGAEGRHREPGHHFEWAWLLDAHEQRLGGACGDEIDALAGFADRYGVNPKTGLIRDGIDDAGGAPAGTHRLWCQTEALRARLMLARRGKPGESQKAAALADAIFRYHLSTVPVGLWHDVVDAGGHNTGGAVPASTLYHLMTLVYDLQTRMPAAEPRT